MIIPVIFALLGVAFAGNVRDANLFMDNVLNTQMPSEINRYQLDPMSLPSFKTNFNSRNMNASFYSGKMYGLRQVRRYGDCSPPGILQGNTTVGCNVVMDRISLDYTSLFNYNGYPQRVVRCLANLTTTYALLEATSAPGRSGVARQLAIRTMGQMNVRLSGLGNIPLFSDIENGYKNEMINMFNHAMRTYYFLALSRAISRVPLPRA